MGAIEPIDKITGDDGCDTWTESQRQLLSNRINRCGRHPQSLKKYLTPSALAAMGKHGLPAKDVFRLFCEQEKQHYLAVAIACAGRLQTWLNTLGSQVKNQPQHLIRVEGSADILDVIVAGIKANRFSMGELAYVCGLPGNGSEEIGKAIETWESDKGVDIKIAVEALRQQEEARPPWNAKKQEKQRSEAHEGLLRTRLMLLLHEFQSASEQGSAN